VPLFERCAEDEGRADDDAVDDGGGQVDGVLPGGGVGGGTVVEGGDDVAGGTDVDVDVVATGVCVGSCVRCGGVDVDVTRPSIHHPSAGKPTSAINTALKQPQPHPVFGFLLIPTAS
jgi:hypothetical protein